MHEKVWKLKYMENKNEAWHHWINFGKNENRIYFSYTMNLEKDDLMVSGNKYKQLDTDISYNILKML